MTRVNWRRVWIGAGAGFVVWLVWSLVCNLVGLGARYPQAQATGQFLEVPRYSFFIIGWVVMLFALAFIVAWLYAGVRATYGAGPKTALLVGALVGFAAGFPENFAIATWLPASRYFPLWWMLELWVGAVLATSVAAWLYHD
jgi:hypothetical protein